jgi:hypothetical protein
MEMSALTDLGFGRQRIRADSGLPKVREDVEVVVRLPLTTTTEV